uniref:Uncharacterized protein n=1 Tax=Oryza punctata TaxID=4537 RepID=A0A0E0LYP4_ORYPU
MLLPTESGHLKILISGYACNSSDDHLDEKMHLKANLAGSTHLLAKLKPILVE